MMHNECNKYVFNCHVFENEKIPNDCWYNEFVDIYLVSISSSQMLVKNFMYGPLRRRLNEKFCILVEEIFLNKFFVFLKI